MGTQKLIGIVTCTSGRRKFFGSGDIKVATSVGWLVNGAGDVFDGDVAAVKRGVCFVSGDGRSGGDVVFLLPIRGWTQSRVLDRVDARLSWSVVNAGPKSRAAFSRHLFRRGYSLGIRHTFAQSQKPCFREVVDWWRGPWVVLAGWRTDGGDCCGGVIALHAGVNRNPHHQNQKYEPTETPMGWLVGAEITFGARVYRVFDRRMVGDDDGLE